MTLVRGAVKVQDLPDLACFKSFEDLLKALEKYLVVEVPDSITNVVISAIPPENPSRDVIWFKLSNSGSFIGIFVFSGGEYLQQFPAPKTIERFYGNSDEVPPGWEVISASTVGFTSAMVAKLQADWLRDSSDTFWLIYDAIYTGL